MSVEYRGPGWPRSASQLEEVGGGSDVDGLNALEATDAGEPQPVELRPGLADGVTIKVRAEPPEHARQLLETLGADYEVDEAAPAGCDHAAVPVAQQELLEEIRALASRLGRTPRLRDSGALVGRATALFGTWSDALDAAGLEPVAKSASAPQTSPDVDEISAGAAAAGSLSAAVQDGRGERPDAPAEPEASGSASTEGGKHNPDSITPGAGTVFDVADLTGQQQPARAPKPVVWPREKIIEALQAEAARIGHPPSYREWKDAKLRPSPPTIVKHFDGRWPDALKAAGLEPNALGVAADGRTWSRARKQPAAEEAASAPTNRGGRTVKWTRENVIPAIVAWTDEHGKAPNSQDWSNAQDGHPACSTVYKIFGKPWENALREAGVLETNDQPPVVPGATRSDPEPPDDSGIIPESEPVTVKVYGGAADAPVIVQHADAEPPPEVDEEEEQLTLADVAEELQAAFEAWEAADERFMTALRAFENEPTLQAIRGYFGEFDFEYMERDVPTVERRILAALKAARGEPEAT